jgi:peptidoglycan hydrolase-like protein with peptidoglycan-binding domain
MARGVAQRPEREQQQQREEGRQEQGGRGHPAGGVRGYSRGQSLVGARAQPAEAAAKHYTIKKGDTLWEIAAAQYGDGSLWPKIWAANKAQIPNPSLIHPGTAIVIPPQEHNGPQAQRETHAPPPTPHREHEATQADAATGPARRPQRPEQPPVQAPVKPGAEGAKKPAPVKVSFETIQKAQDFYDGHPALYPAHVTKKIQATVGAVPDGVLGGETIRQIARWQAAHGLGADGIAGKATLTAMFGSDIRYAAPPKVETTKSGALTKKFEAEALEYYFRWRSRYTPAVVKQIEDKLGVPSDGDVDAAFVQAVAAWQKSHGLKVDGLAGPGTLKAMFGHDIRPGAEQAHDKPGQDKTPDAGTGDLGRPNGYNAIVKTFGEPGTGIITTSMPAGHGGKMISVSCHKKIADKLRAVFEDIKKDGKSEHIRTWDGCYVFRKKRSGSGYSTHSWGIAVDVNASDNPMVKNAKTSDDQRVLVPYFERHGFYWGGHFNDPMHFQYCTGY